MGKVTIYIKLIDGKLVYRDSEKDHGHTIKTKVRPGDKVTWKLDQCADICELTDIKITGSEDFFQKPPKQKDFNEWKASVSLKAQGEITYQPDYKDCGSCTEKSATFSVTSTVEKSDVCDEDPPTIIVDP